MACINAGRTIEALRFSAARTLRRLRAEPLGLVHSALWESNSIDTWWSPRSLDHVEIRRVELTAMGLPPPTSPGCHAPRLTDCSSGGDGAPVRTCFDSHSGLIQGRSLPYRHGSAPLVWRHRKGGSPKPRRTWPGRIDFCRDDDLPRLPVRGCPGRGPALGRTAGPGPGRRHVRRVHGDAPDHE